MTQQNTQAVVLQQPNDQKLVVKIEQDPDWISIGALFVSFLAFVVTIYVVKKSSESQIESNIDLIKSQEKLKIRELKILNKNTALDKVRDLIGENLYLAGNLQNQIEIAIKEIGERMPDKFFHSRNFGEFKTTLNSYQSSINKIMVYLDNDDSQHYKQLNEHLRKIQLLSWNLYTADINIDALRLGLKDWESEYKYGKQIIQNYLKHEFDKIYKI
ncbi:MAG: hypothetical protein KAY38_04865 [Acinetobacter sp.]|nr:hypothetical protein [Acinetobacter sp.]